MKTMMKDALTGKTCIFYFHGYIQNDYEQELVGYNGKECVVGLFDGEVYNVTFDDGSEYDVFLEEIYPKEMFNI